MENYNNINSNRNVNSIVGLYGFGKITLLLLLTISFGIIADGIEMTLMGLFVIPITKYYSLNEFEIQVISSILFLGVALGSYISSYMVHFLFRKKTLHYGYILLLSSHIILSFSFHYYIFAFARFFIGVALGIIIPVSLNLLSEFLPGSSRALVLTGIWAFFSLGQGLQASIMLVGMPNLETSNMKYVLFSLTVFILIAFVLNDKFGIESPKHLILNEQYEEGFKVLNEMLKTKNEEELTYDEKEAIINEIKSLSNNDPSNNKVDIENLFAEHMYTTTLFTILLMFILSFLFYGILLISTLTMRKLNIHETNNTNYSQIIANQIIVAFCSMPGNIIGGVLCEIKKMGRRKTICLGFIISTICSFSIIIFRSQYTILYSMYLFFVNISFNVCLTYVVEIYPTQLRDTSSGFLFACLRISGFFSQYLYLALHIWHYMLPYYFSGIISALAIVITINLPYEPGEQEFDGEFESIKNK